MLRITVIAALALFCSIAHGVDQASKDEIIARCKGQMEQYGAAMVKACVDQDFAAWKSVQTFKDTHAEIYTRCSDQMKSYGFAMIEACIDGDIKALSDISGIPAEHEKIVARCADQMGSYGHAMVLACAERDIEAEEALKKY